MNFSKENECWFLKILKKKKQMKWKTQNRQFQYSEVNIYSLKWWNKYYSRLTNTHTACHLSSSCWRWDTERSRMLLCRAAQKGWRRRDGIRKERVSDGWIDILLELERRLKETCRVMNPPEKWQLHTHAVPQVLFSSLCWSDQSRVSHPVWSGVSLQLYLQTWPTFRILYKPVPA